MELKKINYVSAVYFGVIALVFGFVLGLIQVYLSTQRQDVASQLGLPLGVSPAYAIIINPLLAMLVYYLAAVVMIWLYNTTAKKYPISWNVSK